MISFVASNLLRNKRRSILTLIGIIIGVAGIISIVGISLGISRNTSKMMESFNGIYLMQYGAVDEQYSRIDTSKYVDELFKINGISYVLPEIYTTGTVDIKNFISPMLVIVGIDPVLSAGYDEILYYKVDNGRDLKSTDK